MLQVTKDNMIEIFKNVNGMWCIVCTDFTVQISIRLGTIYLDHEVYSNHERLYRRNISFDDENDEYIISFSYSSIDYIINQDCPPISIYSNLFETIMLLEGVDRSIKIL